MILKQSTGAATLLIHMLANIATPIHVSSTVLGLVPALLKVKVAIIFAMLYLLSAAAMVKPPSNSMITGVHMAAKMYDAAALEVNRACGLTSCRTTWSTTTKKGTRSDVTKRGMAYQ